MPSPVLLLVPGGAAASGSGSFTLLVVYVVVGIGVSFLCSILEATLLSVTPAYVGAMSETDPTAAARLKRLKDDVDRPLAAILSLNTVAHTIGAAGAGAEAAAVYGSAVVGVFSGGLTLAILVFSEIIPKTLGAVHWRGLAPLAGRLLVPLIWVTYPLVLLSQGLTKVIARGEREGSVSREEIAALTQIGHEEGVFDATESKTLRSLLRFHKLAARDAMTPRPVLVAYPETTPLRAIADDGEPFSRLPLYGEDRDDVVGYVLRGDVLKAVADGEGDAPASTVARDILTVRDTLPLPRLFERLLDRREHLALVVGEYGGTAGVVSVEDVVETLLGLEIMDEVDAESDMQAAARRQWEARAARLGLADGGGAAERVARERAATITAGITGGAKPPGGGPLSDPSPAAVEAERRRREG